MCPLAQIDAGAAGVGQRIQPIEAEQPVWAGRALDPTERRRGRHVHAAGGDRAHPAPGRVRREPGRQILHFGHDQLRLPSGYLGRRYMLPARPDVGRDIGEARRLQAFDVDEVPPARLQAFLAAAEIGARPLPGIVSAGLGQGALRPGRQRGAALGHAQKIAQVAKQAQELAFYKGIVEQGVNAPEVKIQQLRISAGDAPGRFRLRITLVQPVRSDRSVDGVISARVEGEREGGPLALDLAALTADKRAEIPFSFRYFENIDPEITLPAGFSPERVSVEVRSAKKGVAPVTQTLMWSVE